MSSVSLLKKRTRDSLDDQNVESKFPIEDVKLSNSPILNLNENFDICSDTDSGLESCHLSDCENDIAKIENSYIDSTVTTDQNTPSENVDIDLIYDSEDSENERTLITIGNVPARWYDDLDHIGYDQEGEVIAKPKYEDQIDTFVALNKSANSWMSVYDEKTGERHSITEHEVGIIKRLREGIVPEKYDAQHWFIPVATSHINIMPKSSALLPKSSYVPPKWEAARMRKIADAIKRGHIKLDRPEKKIDKPLEFYPIWDMAPSDTEGKTLSQMLQNRLSAPKEKLPTDSESYNPPPEFLKTQEEERKWRLRNPANRKNNYLPRMYPNLRSVPSYNKYVYERFQRCLNLYLASRTQVKRKRYDISTLLPKLPSPSELRPYPTVEIQSYIGHRGAVHSISVDPSGCWLASGGEDGTLRLWEIKSTYCIQVWDLKSPVSFVSWNPNPLMSVIAVSTSQTVRILQSPTANSSQIKYMNEVFADFRSSLHQKDTNENSSNNVVWMRPTDSQWKDGWRVNIEYNSSSSGKDISKLAWHHKGDYLSTVAPKSTPPLLVHQLSKRKTQIPCKRSRLVSCSTFHPKKPFFIMASQTHVYIYDLVKQVLIKKLQPNVSSISDIAVHPQGDNLIIGSYNKKVSWFDLDLGTKPYKTLRHHTAAVRSVAFHKYYPLFASASDDSTIQIFHGTVYDDFMLNPMIVPLKILRGHSIQNNVGVLSIAFHPTQPWVFSSGADSTIRLFV